MSKEEQQNICHTITALHMNWISCNLPPKPVFTLNEVMPDIYTPGVVQAMRLLLKHNFNIIENDYSIAVLDTKMLGLVGKRDIHLTFDNVINRLPGKLDKFEPVFTDDTFAATKQYLDTFERLDLEWHPVKKMLKKLSAYTTFGQALTQFPGLSSLQNTEMFGTECRVKSRRPLTTDPRVIEAINTAAAFFFLQNKPLKYERDLPNAPFLDFEVKVG